MLVKYTKGRIEHAEDTVFMLTEVRERSSRPDAIYDAIFGLSLG